MDTAYWTDHYTPVGGNPALDFVNTLGDRHSATPVEHLQRYGDLVWGAWRIGILPEPEAERLAATRRVEAAEAVRLRALTLREALHRIFAAVAQGHTPAAPDLAVLNDVLTEAHGRFQVGPGAGGFAWQWTYPEDALDGMLGPLAHAAADLLTSEHLVRVRACAAADCGWLFLDLSRNRSRRWCDMRACGNRAKARRYYRRRQSER